jgi:hypothetical protein
MQVYRMTDHVEHAHASLAVLSDCRYDEDDTHAHEDEEDPARLHKFHNGAADEPTGGKGTLRSGKISSCS